MPRPSTLFAVLWVTVGFCAGMVVAGGLMDAMGHACKVWR
jgi:hypothetical protein